MAPVRCLLASLREHDRTHVRTKGAKTDIKSTVDLVECPNGTVPQNITVGEGRAERKAIQARERFLLDVSNYAPFRKTSAFLGCSNIQQR
jgi:hypothetical protein